MPAGLAGTVLTVDSRNSDVAFNAGSEHIIGTRDGGATWHFHHRRCRQAMNRMRAHDRQSAAQAQKDKSMTSIRELLTTEHIMRIQLNIDFLNL